MDIQVKKDQDHCEIVLQGDMTIYTALQCKEEIMKAIKECKSVTVDLSGVYEMDTSGLQIISLFLKETLIKDIRVRFSAISDSVQEFMDFCGLGRILNSEAESSGVAG